MIPPCGTRPGPVAADVQVEAATRSRRHAGGWLVVLGIVLASVNLRSAITSMGALLADVRAGLGMSETAAGVVTTLPVLCFGVVGLLAPALARRLGRHRLMLAAMAAVALGLAGRAGVGSAAGLIAGTAVTTSGIALANVLIPVLVKQHFPERIGLLTGLYTMGLQAGTAVAAAVSVPLAALSGGWRGGLGWWALLAALAVVPWLAVARQDDRPADASAARTAADAAMDAAREHALPLRAVLRRPLTWGLALFFGMQALSAYTVMGWLPDIYRSAGFSQAEAGLMLAVAMGLGIPVSMALPALATRSPDQRPWVVLLTACTAAGYAGLALAPAAGAWLWVLLVGLGNGAFPLALAMIGMRARYAANTARLSVLAQGVGYLLAAVGPFAVGVIHDVARSWTIALAFLGALLVPQLAGGLIAGRPVHLEG